MHFALGKVRLRQWHRSADELLHRDLRGKSAVAHYQNGSDRFGRLEWRAADRYDRSLVTLAVPRVEKGTRSPSNVEDVGCALVGHGYTEPKPRALTKQCARTNFGVVRNDDLKGQPLPVRRSIVKGLRARQQAERDFGRGIRFRRAYKQAVRRVH